MQNRLLKEFFRCFPNGAAKEGAFVFRIHAAARNAPPSLLRSDASFRQEDFDFSAKVPAIKEDTGSSVSS